MGTIFMVSFRVHLLSVMVTLWTITLSCHTFNLGAEDMDFIRGRYIPCLSLFITVTWVRLFQDVLSYNEKERDVCLKKGYMCGIQSEPRAVSTSH